MKLLFELSWLWESIAIIALVITVCEVCALLICKARKQKLSKKAAIIIAFISALATCLANCFAFPNTEFIKSEFIVYIIQKADSL